MALETEEIRQGISIRDLLDAGLHFGHQTKRWNPKMKRYIFDKRNGIHVIDLAKSMALLQNSLDFVHDLVINGKSVLFVGTKKQAQKVITEVAEETGQHYVTHRWLGGTLTNRTTIRRSVRRMRELEKLETDNAMAELNKKEAAMLRRELAKLRRNLSGVADMADLPGALFVIDITREAIAVAEARKLNIPVIAIVDTNCDPDPIDYVIPGNDDAIRAIKLISHAFRDTIKEANVEYSRRVAEQEKKRQEEEAKRKAETEARKAEAKKAADAARAAKEEEKKAAKQKKAEEAKAAEKAKAASAPPAEAAAPAKAPAAAKTEQPAQSDAPEAAPVVTPPQAPAPDKTAPADDTAVEAPQPATADEATETTAATAAAAAEETEQK